MADLQNPWLTIPEADYVGHMSHPDVDQRPVLNCLLRDVLDRVKPRELLIAGASTGNGLEHVDAAITSRVTAVDINPQYLGRLIERFSGAGYRLNVRCLDIATCAFERDTYDLIHAALVLEYVPWRPVLPRLASALAPGGTLSVVVQAESAATPAVTPTAFTSLRALERVFQFVYTDALVAAAAVEGLVLCDERAEPLPGGKAFEVLRFERR